MPQKGYSTIFSCSHLLKNCFLTWAPLINVGCDMSHKQYRRNFIGPKSSKLSWTNEIHPLLLMRNIARVRTGILDFLAKFSWVFKMKTGCQSEVQFMSKNLGMAVQDVQLLIAGQVPRGSKNLASRGGVQNLAGRIDQEGEIYLCFSDGYPFFLWRLDCLNWFFFTLLPHPLPPLAQLWRCW